MSAPNTLPPAIKEASQDRKILTVEIGGKNYTATKPRKSDEWFLDLVVAFSGETDGQSIQVMLDFLAKILGPEQYKDIQARRRDEEDDLTFEILFEALTDAFELWTSEADQPIRPTGQPSVFSMERKPTVLKSTEPSS